jgi:hypothetical protein
MMEGSVSREDIRSVPSNIMISPGLSFKKSSLQPAEKKIPAKRMI